MTFEPTSVEVTCVSLPKDHCVQIPWGYISVCGYSNQFCKSLQNFANQDYHILHKYYIHTTYRISDHIVDFWTKFRRDKNWRYSNGAVKLLLFCIGRRLLMLVFCVSIYVMHTNISKAQSCYKRLALADVDWCTAMKSERTISPHHGSIRWSPAPWSFIWELKTIQEHRYRLMAITYILGNSF